MNKLTQENINDIATTVNAIRIALNKKMINNALEANIAIEQSLTLDALEKCLATYSDDAEGALSTAFVNLLAERWERIRYSPLSYTKRPSDPVNLLCLNIARQIAPIPDNKDEIDQLSPAEGPCFLIMPSLKAWRDASGTNIHHFALHQFILSDHHNLFIPVENCLVDAMDSDTGQLKHQVSDPEDRYSLKIVNLNEQTAPHDDEIPAHELWLYLHEDMIYCAAKNKERFVLSQEELGEQLSDEEQQRLYENIKQALTPPRKNTLKLHRNNQGDVFCLYQKPGVRIPVRLVLDNQYSREHANDIIQRQPVLSMRDHHIVCTTKTTAGDEATVIWEDSELGENATSIREALQQSVPKKALTIEEESAIFAAILSKGYRREQQDFANLTENEKKQVIHHSSVTEHYHQGVTLAQQQKNGASLGGALWSLYIALGSGAHRAGAANAMANEGIAVFSNYWNTYSAEDKTLLYATYPGLLSIINNLNLNPNTRNEEHCIGLTGGDIQALLNRHPSIYNTETINKAHHRQLLASGMANTNYRLFDHHPNEPLDTSRFSTLSPAFFRHAYTQQILRYALEQEEALSVSVLCLLPQFTDPDKQHLLNLTNEQGDTALIRATSCQIIDVVSDLITATPAGFIDVKNNRGETALMRTVMNKKTGAAIAEQLILAGANINSKNKYGATAITLAVRHNNPEVLHVIIKHSQEPLLTRKEALRFAIINQSPMLETLLIDASALPTHEQNRLFLHLLPEDKPGHQANTALMYATLTQHPVLDVLLQEQSLSQEEKNAALLLAVENNIADGLMALIRAGADINAANALGASALDIALKNNLTDVIDVLEHYQAKTSLHTHSHSSPILLNATEPDESQSDDRFITAVKEGRLADVRAFIEAGADINAFYSSGKTALIIAIENKRLDMALLLLSSGTDIRHAKDSDANAFHLAQSQAPDFDLFIDQLLLKALSLHLNDQQWLLSKTKHMHVLDYVFHRKAALLPQFLEEITKINDPISRLSILNSRNQHGNTLLHMAVKDALQTGRTNRVAQLIQAGAYPDITNANGDSPLSLAMKYPLNDGLATITHLLNGDAQIAPLRDGVETLAGLAFDDDLKIEPAAVEQPIQPVKNKLLTEQSIKDHIDIFEKHIYAFPANSTIAIREPLILALSDLFDSRSIKPQNVRFKKITEPLSCCFDNPALSGVNRVDHEKFREIMKSTVNKAILYLRTMTDDQLEQFIDEKWAEQRSSDLSKKRPVVAPLPQNPFDEALDDLNITLQDPTYTDNLKEAGTIIRDVMIKLRNTKDNDALTRVLIITNASIKNPSIKHVEACSIAINEVDKDNKRLKGALMIFAGIALIITIAVAIAMSFGAFSAIGIPAFGIIAKVLIAELGCFLGLPASAVPIVLGIHKAIGDPVINKAHHGFFQLKQATRVINEEPRNDQDPEPDTGQIP